MQSLLILIDSIINLYIWIVIINVVLSWLIVFNIINTQNRFVYSVVDTLNRLVEPALAPIRRFMPNLGGIDLSPVILILGLIFLRNLLHEFFGGGVRFVG